jgi:hypothetical protein
MAQSTIRPTPHRPAGRRIAGRAQSDQRGDPYQPARQPAGPVVCPQCQVVHSDGRWHWGAPPPDAGRELCPACRRQNDDFPAGIVTMHGPIAPARRAEMIALARHQEAAEKPEHPLNRIIRVAESDDALVITTTDIHLPRRIGEALTRAYHGELDVVFEEDGYFVRVDWRPPAS